MRFQIIQKVNLITGMLLVCCFQMNLLTMALVLYASYIVSEFVDEDNPNTTDEYLRLSAYKVEQKYGYGTFYHSPARLLLLSGIFYLITELICMKFPIVRPYFTWIFVTTIICLAIPMVLQLFINPGIPLLYPFCSKKFHLTKYRRGSKYEWIAVVIAALILVIIGGYRLYQREFFTETWNIIQSVYQTVIGWIKWFFH